MTKNKIMFEMTEEHIALVRKLYVTDGCFDERTVICGKRPFGNSDIVRDIAEILDIEPKGEGEDNEFTEDQEDYIVDLYKGLYKSLQIVLSTGKFKPGKYTKVDDYSQKWKRVK